MTKHEYAEYDFNLVGFQSVLKPTAVTIGEYVPHLSIDPTGRVSDEGWVRHQDFMVELALIQRTHQAELSRATGNRRTKLIREHDAMVKLFFQRGLHQRGNIKS